MKRPNILLIMTDEQRVDTLSCAGNHVIKTPNIDAIAEQGCMFENCYCASPLCVPSRVSFFTGQYVHKNMATSNAPKAHIKDEQGCLIDVLKSNGYKIGLAGKNHTFDKEYMTSRFDFWEEYFHFGKTHGTFTETDCKIIEYYKEHRFEGLIDSPAPFDEQDWVTSRIAQDGIRFVEENKDSPFFLYYSFPDPHWPNVTCEPYYSMYPPESITLEGMDIDWTTHPFKSFVQANVNGFEHYSEDERKRIVATYFGQTAFIDKAVGQMTDALKRHGLYDNTIIIYTADHGNFAGRYGLIGKSCAFPDALVRIPLIIKAPGTSKTGISQAQISNIDILPTVLDLNDIDLPQEIQGLSFKDVLLENTPEHRSEIYAEVGHPDIPLSPIPIEAFAEHHKEMCKKRGWNWFWDYIGNGRGVMLKKDDWKYCYHVHDLEELYDMKSDPYEITNLAYNNDYSDIKNNLKNRVMDWIMTMPLSNNETFHAMNINSEFK